MQERPTNQRGSDDDNDLGADIEGLGVFYLGKRVDPESGKPGREPLLLDARRLTLTSHRNSNISSRRRCACSAPRR